jgi:hypothetical protein
MKDGKAGYVLSSEKNGSMAEAKAQSVAAMNKARKGREDSARYVAGSIGRG